MFIRYNLFAFLWALLVLLLTLTPGQAMPETDIWASLAFDKVVHMFVFAVLVVLLIVGFKKQYDFPFFRFQAVKLALGIALAYGLLIEGIQALIPERSLELGDLLADSLGCGLGYAIFYWIYKT